MSISCFDLFKIGIGPSSSHTVGPMKAAYRFCLGTEEKNVAEKTCSIKIHLFGSLAFTGLGHGTDKAIALGLEKQLPDLIDPEVIEPRKSEIMSSKKLLFCGNHEIDFDLEKDLILNFKEELPFHTNGMKFFAYDSRDKLLHTQTYYSIGGGFVVNEDTAKKDELKKDNIKLTYEFNSGADILAICKKHKISIADMMFENEKCWRSNADEIDKGLKKILEVMNDCIDRGCKTSGILPGRLKVKRRAAEKYKKLSSSPEKALRDPLTILDWVNLYALAVNEENAAGARVVTAPTNGAAGVVPAVIRYYNNFCEKPNWEGNKKFLLTSAAIGILYTKNASISGAEVGCQGEVGVACSMAAAGLTAALGGSPEQIEEAAEIGMEHNLGLTCDPIDGLVQIPCIERNAMAAVKAINSSRIALSGDGDHKVSLDDVIKTMQETGRDMQSKYKETSKGGLAVNITEC